ncbi:MAG: spore cortex biosynthesis protein YabQ [Eubacteriaceae bacterium]|nr:spore cortex biosynthesis protein YabQ [Eubacteriaceae bacterium]
MQSTNLIQLAAFSKVFACGVSIGFFYDACTVFLMGKRHSALSDIIFWIISACLVSSSLYYATQFSLRLYLLLGFLLGWGLYALLLTRIMAYFFNPLKDYIIELGRVFGILAEKSKKLLAKPAMLLKKGMSHYNKYAKYIFRKKPNAEED